MIRGYSQGRNSSFKSGVFSVVDDLLHEQLGFWLMCILGHVSLSVVRAAECPRSCISGSRWYDKISHVFFGATTSGR